MNNCHKHIIGMATCLACLGQSGSRLAFYAGGERREFFSDLLELSIDMLLDPVEE